MKIRQRTWLWTLLAGCIWTISH